MRVCILTSMDMVVGPRMIRKSNSLELVVQHRVFSRSTRAATQGRTHKAGKPEIHRYYVAGLETKAYSEVII